MTGDNSVVTLERDRVSRGTAVGVMSRWQCRVMRAHSSLMFLSYQSCLLADGSMAW